MMRFTSNKPVEDMGMYELAHNSCYIDKYGCARYRDSETDVDARELARDLMREYGLWDVDDDAMLSDDVFDNEIMDNLMYDTKDIQGMIALFYRNLWVMAELREALKVYEDAEEQGVLLRLPAKVGDKYYRISMTCSMGGDEEKGKFFPTASDCDKWCMGAYRKIPCDKEYMVEEYTFQNIEQIIDKCKYLEEGHIFLTKAEAEKALAELQSK